MSLAVAQNLIRELQVYGVNALAARSDLKSALAVLSLITSSYLVDARTGKQAARLPARLPLRFAFAL